MFQMVAKWRSFKEPCPITQKNAWGKLYFGEKSLVPIASPGERPETP